MPFYEVNVRGKDWAREISAATAGKAKYLYLLRVRDAWEGVSFKHLTCRTLRAMSPTPMEIAQREADAFNARHPVGTLLNYWSWTREGEPTGTAPINHVATVVCGSAVIWMQGVSSCHSITHVERVAAGGA